MKNSIYIFLLAVIISCSSTSESNELTNKDLLLGRWRLAAAQIDGVDFPVTGISQLEIIETIFEDDNYYHVFPKVDENNNPISPIERDTISGPWGFNTDETRLILDRSSVGEPDFIWEIVNLRLGYLETLYEGPSAGSTSETSIYRYIYTQTLN